MFASSARILCAYTDYGEYCARVWLNGLRRLLFLQRSSAICHCARGGFFFVIREIYYSSDAIITKRTNILTGNVLKTIGRVGSRLTSAEYTPEIRNDLIILYVESVETTIRGRINRSDIYFILFPRSNVIHHIISVL